MKKIMIFSLALLVCAVALYAGCRISDRVMTDRTPPVITGKNTVKLSVEDPEEKLLTGLKAEDDRDGDVTSSLVVQKISKFDSNHHRIVNCAAADKSGNVSFFSRTVAYTDYTAPRFGLNASLRFPLGSEFTIGASVTAQSTLDGSLTGRIKYTLDRTVSTTMPGTYQAEFRVTDSTGTTSYLQVPVDVYDPQQETLSVKLKNYLVYLNRGTAFDPMDYYVSDNDRGSLDVKSNVNMSRAGTYYVDYIKTMAGQKGCSRLVVIVM